MATKGAIAARQAVAHDRLGAALTRLAEREGVDVPEEQPFPYRQPELRAASKMEHYAKVVETILGDEPDEKPEDGEGHDGDEPTFHGHKLSEFDGLSDEDALKLEGIGPATLKRVRRAQKKAERANAK